MTFADIVNIVSTVAAAQVLCDWLAKKLIYSRDPYKRAVSAMQRAAQRREKTAASASSSTTQSNASLKNAKKLKQAEDEYNEAAADVARRRILPTFGSSFLFLLIARILGIEYKGKIVALLPFQPYSILQRVTMRGLTVVNTISKMDIQDKTNILPTIFLEQNLLRSSRLTDVSQISGFLFIYILATMSVKFTLGKYFGEPAPTGAENGLSTIMDAPRNQKILESVGVNLQDLKKNL